MTEPPDAEPAETDPVAEPPPVAEPSPPEPQRRRLRAIPAFAVASMLVAGGLLMAVSGMVRIVEPAPPTPTPTVAPSAAPTPTPIVPSTPPLGPTASPFG